MLKWFDDLNSGLLSQNSLFNLKFNIFEEELSEICVLEKLFA